MRSKKKLTLKRRNCGQSVDKGVFVLYLFFEKMLPYRTNARLYALIVGVSQKEQNAV